MLRFACVMVVLGFGAPACDDGTALGTGVPPEAPPPAGLPSSAGGGSTNTAPPAAPGAECAGPSGAADGLVIEPSAHKFAPLIVGGRSESVRFTIKNGGS